MPVLSPKKRKCPVDGCCERIDRERVFCRKHWYALPDRMRNEIWRAYHKARGSEKHLRLLAEARRYIELLEKEGAQSDGD